MQYCSSGERGNQPVLLNIFIPCFCVHVLIACVLLPLLLKNLHGHSKGFFVFQQVAVVLYLLFTFLESLIDQNMSFSPTHPPMPTSAALTTETELKLVYNLMNYLNNIKNVIDHIRKPAKFSYLWDSLRNIFFYQQALFSILQSFYYKALICDSLNFAEYRKNSMRRSIFAVLCSIFLSFPHLIFFGLELSRAEVFDDPNFVHRYYKQVLYLFDMTGMVIVKAMTIVIMVLVAYSVKRALNLSVEIRDQGTDRSSLPPLFIVVCLVPLLNNFLFLFGDVPRFILYLVHYLVGIWKYSGCLDHKSYFSVNIFLPLNFSVYCIGSLLQCSAFLFYFPNLRKKLCFARSHD